MIERLFLSLFKHFETAKANIIPIIIPHNPAITTFSVNTLGWLCCGALPLLLGVHEGVGVAGATGLGDGGGIGGGRGGFMYDDK